MLNHLAPGAYRLQVQANNTDGQKTEWQSTDFSVMAAAPLELSDGVSQCKKEIILPTTPD
jgi:predicted phage tail protein